MDRNLFVIKMHLIHQLSKTIKHVSSCLKEMQKTSALILMSNMSYLLGIMT